MIGRYAPLEITAVDGRQFTLRLFREGTVGAVLRLEHSVPVYKAVLDAAGAISCRGFMVTRLAEIERLCGDMISAGLPDGALQVRTARGDPVCFTASIAALVPHQSPAPNDPQGALDFDL